MSLQTRPVRQKAKIFMTMHVLLTCLRNSGWAVTTESYDALALRRECGLKLLNYLYGC